MADVSIRNLDDDVRDRLRVRAAEHGRSMEAEIREILADAVRVPARRMNIAEAILERFGANGGVDLDIPPRSMTMRPDPFA